MTFTEALQYFREHLIELNADIYQYKTVFLDKPGNRSVISKAGGLFFEQYHKFFWNHLTLVLSRLTDRRYSGQPRKDGSPPKHENLVIETLISMARTAEMKSAVTAESIYEDVIAKLTDFREARNKVIAHTDQEWFMEKESIVLHLSEAEGAMHGLEQMIRMLSLEHSGTWDDLKPTLSDDAYRLMFVLREGLILEHLEDETHRSYEADTSYGFIAPIERPKSE
jgi:hypothetical protein